MVFGKTRFFEFFEGDGAKNSAAEATKFFEERSGNLSVEGQEVIVMSDLTKKIMG